MWPRFKSQHRCHIMCIEFIVVSLPCFERFFYGYADFPSPRKPTFPNSNLTRNGIRRIKPPCGCATSKSYIYHISLFIYWYICAHCSRSKQLSLFCLWFKLFWWDHSSCYRPIWWRCLPVPLVRFLVSKVLPFPIHSPESLQMDTSESWHFCLPQRCQR